jgi:hypothetical protein
MLQMADVRDPKDGVCFTGGGSRRSIKDRGTVPVSTVSHSHKHNAEAYNFSSLDRKYNLIFYITSQFLTDLHEVFSLLHSTHTNKQSKSLTLVNLFQSKLISINCFFTIIGV